jgi:hypothetical protein
MIQKLISKKKISSIIISETPPPHEEEEEEIIPPLQQVDEVMRPQPKKTKKYGSRVKSRLLNLSETALTNTGYSECTY